MKCHGKKKARGELDFSKYTESRHVAADFRRWSHVIEFIRKEEMPPEDEPQPTLEERKAATQSLERVWQMTNRAILALRPHGGAEMQRRHQSP